MKSISVSIGIAALLLVGAGCATPDTVPTADEQNQPSPQQTQNSDPQPQLDLEPEPVVTERGVDISGDNEARSFLNDRTSAHIYESYKLFTKASLRMVKDINAAGPAGSKFYEKLSWIPEDPTGSKMVAVGQEAALIILDAQKAFEDNTSSEISLSASARNKVNEWVKTIDAFEAKWGVRN